MTSFIYVLYELKFKALLGGETDFLKVDCISHCLNSTPGLDKYYKVNKSCALKILVLPVDSLMVRISQVLNSPKNCVCWSFKKFFKNCSDLLPYKAFIKMAKWLL